jgi:hypothetical protein
MARASQAPEQQRQIAREDMMGSQSLRMRLGSSLMAAFVCIAWVGSSAIARPVPVIAFDADIDFLKLPRDLYLGEVTGVAVDSKRQVFVYEREIYVAELLNWRMQKPTLRP